MRRGELTRLTWEDIDLDHQYPSIVLNETKTYAPRTIPLWKEGVDVLKDYAKQNNLEQKGNVFPVNNETMITRQFIEAVKLSKVKDLRFHDLRHEATSRLFEETELRDLEIMEITGHKSHRMLKRYAHLRTKKLSRAERKTG